MYHLAHNLCAKLLLYPVFWIVHILAFGHLCAKLLFIPMSLIGRLTFGYLYAKLLFIPMSLIVHLAFGHQNSRHVSSRLPPENLS